MVDYLTRYTHRTAIGNKRLVGIDADVGRLRVRADNHGGKRTIAIPGEQFIARLLRQILPGGFKCIRHHGLLAPCAKTERLAQARRLLAMPAANLQAKEDARALMRRVAGIELNTCPTATAAGAWWSSACRTCQRCGVAAGTRRAVPGAAMTGAVMTSRAMDGGEERCLCAMPCAQRAPQREPAKGGLSNAASTIRPRGQQSAPAVTQAQLRSKGESALVRQGV